VTVSSTSRPRRRRAEGKGLLATLVAAALVVSGGFAVGLIAGIVFEEPGLMLDYWTGRTTPVTGADVAARSEPKGTPVPADGQAGSSPRRGAPAHATDSSDGRSLDVAAAPPSSGFAVQVGAFSEASAARRLAGELRAAELPVYVVPGSAAADARWRVRVGPVSTRREAERLATRLKRREKLPTWVLSESPR
jgi:cell division septation protein DedD